MYEKQCHMGDTDEYDSNCYADYQEEGYNKLCEWIYNYSIW